MTIHDYAPTVMKLPSNSLRPLKMDNNRKNNHMGITCVSSNFSNERYNLST